LTGHLKLVSQASKLLARSLENSKSGKSAKHPLAAKLYLKARLTELSAIESFLYLSDGAGGHPTPHPPPALAHHPSPAVQAGCTLGAAGISFSRPLCSTNIYGAPWYTLIS